jgi:hypothetical protein
MVCNYDMTLADVIAAQRAFAPPVDTIRFGRGLIGWILFVALAVMLFTLLNNGTGRASRVGTVAPRQATAPKSWLFPTGVAVSVAGGLMFASLLAINAYVRRSRRPMKNAHVTVRLEDQGVAVTTAYREDGITWDGMRDVSETQEHFILQTVGPHPVILPKRGFADAGDVDQVRRTLAARVIRTAQRAPA